MKSLEHKSLKYAYREIIGIVTTVLNEWDPYALIAGGAPNDEFAEEAARIAAKIREINTPMVLAEVISDIFSKEFEPELFSVEACMPVASKLYNDLQTQGFLK